ncbi:S8 family serine peptidase [Pseudomonas sp. NPDC087612]|uniref:S8 family serine peptidase n=1 Tax=Pseudomonas sp. NPDC087612 TaxID=3364441 RepID=UPI0038156C2D
MQTDLMIYRNVYFDGNIYVKYNGMTTFKTTKYQLYRDGKKIAEIDSSENGETICFENQIAANYKASFVMELSDGKILTGDSMEIDAAFRSPLLPESPPTRSQQKSLKGGHYLYENVTSHFLEVKFHPGGLEKLKNETSRALTTFARLKSGLTFNLVFSPTTTKKKGLESFADFYRIDGPIATDELIPVATELETLDYVIYCSVTPDTRNMQPPELPLTGAPATEEQQHASNNSTTPNFNSLQGYLDPTRGMNVRHHWERKNGRLAVVRHLDFGIYRNHEDLRNVFVMSSRPETQDCNHGTASTGCIVGTNNGFGVTGISYNCSFYFYDTSYIDWIVRDARHGDIVGIDNQFSRDGKLLPMIDNKSYWDKIQVLTNRHITVILAAGNGGLNLSTPGVMNDWGDSGSMLAGACSSSTGRRLSFSNFGHITSMISSWGENVTTTGYGGLQSAGNNASYTRSYNGTSSATPLSVGAIAVVQGHSLEGGGYYPPDTFRSLLERLGYTEGVTDKIGYRPNVRALIEAYGE